MWDKIWSIAWDLLLLVVPVAAGYFFNVIQKKYRKKTLKDLLRFEFKNDETPKIKFITANTDIWDETELVTLGYIFEYMSVGEIKSSLSSLYGPKLITKTAMSKKNYADIKMRNKNGNLILIGGPNHNSVTREFMYNRMKNCPFSYEDDCSLIYKNEKGEIIHRYKPDLYDPTVESGKKPYFEGDYALIMNVRSPLDPQKRVIFISGCRSVGCYGAAVYLSQKLKEIKKMATSDEYALVIKCGGEREDLSEQPTLCKYFPLEIQYKDANTPATV